MPACAIFFEYAIYFRIAVETADGGASFGRAGGNGSICEPETGAEIMQFSLIIYQPPSAFATANDPAAAAAYTAGWTAYAAALSEAGAMAGGIGLQGPDTATTIRFGGDGPLVQDGPFADTKEQLGGIFNIDVPNLDAAMKWAARAPLKFGGSVEVRPVLHMSGR